MKLSAFFLISLILTVHRAKANGEDEEEQRWQRWKSENADQEIGREEEDFRRSLFHETFTLVKGHNQAAAQKGYELSLNKFAASAVDELKQTRLGFNSPPHSLGRLQADPAIPQNVSVADAIDWRTSNSVSPVKDQGRCGSCWAFATTGALESRNYIKTKKMTLLSEQNLIDCSRNYGNAGCGGGLMLSAFNYIKHAGGVNSGAKYPYIGRDNQGCKYAKNESLSPLKDPFYVQVPAGDENELMKAVNTGPVTIAFEVTRTLYYYKTGVYSDSGCRQALNHAMLVVGYGTDAATKKPFWLVKNSWGAWWGEQGYVRILRGSNMCGIANMASYPVV